MYKLSKVCGMNCRMGSLIIFVTVICLVAVSKGEHLIENDSNSINESVKAELRKTVNALKQEFNRVLSETVELKQDNERLKQEFELQSKTVEELKLENDKLKESFDVQTESLQNTILELNVVKEDNEELRRSVEKFSELLEKTAEECKHDIQEMTNGFARQMKHIYQAVDELRHENVKMKQGYVIQEERVRQQQNRTEALALDVNTLKSVPAEYNTIKRRQVETVGFTAYLDHRVDVHPDGTLRFNQVLYNDGNAYNVHTGIFTVPITGTYIVSFTVEEWQNSEAIFRLLVDGVNTIDTILTTSVSAQSGNTAVLGLMQGQSVWVETNREGKAFGSSAFHSTSFCAALVYY